MSPRRMLLGLAALAGVSSAAAQQSVTVPLQLIKVGGIYKMGLYVGMGGAAQAKLYELDTGASGFYAAYNAQWWPAFTSTGTTASQTYHSGISYQGAVVATQVTIFSDATTPTIASGTSNVAQIQTATYSGSGSNPVPNWTADVAAGVAPLYKIFFGDFGMDLSSHNGLFGILPQLPGDLAKGFIVHVGRFGETQPTLQIGISAADRAKFPYSEKMKGADTGNPFPTSGLPTYSQKLIKGAVVLSGSGRPYAFETDVIFDTGAPTTDIHDDGNAFGIPSRYLHDGGVANGAGFQLVGKDAPAWSFGFVAGDVAGINEVLVETNTDGAFMNAGLNPFVQYDIMFDVEKGRVRFRPVLEDYDVSVRASARGKAVVFTVKNNGLIPTAMTLRGRFAISSARGAGRSADARPRVAVNFYRGRRAVTGAVRRGTCQTRQLLPGQWEDLALRVKTRGAKPVHRRSLTVTLEASCAGNPAVSSSRTERLRFD